VRNEIIIIAAVVVLYWVLRKLFPARPKPHFNEHNGHESRISHSSPYQAVSIHCYEGACADALQLQGTRYLTGDAPLIPLETCSAAKCHCVYRHHDDRRSGEKDRRKLHETGEERPVASGPEDRRHLPGRRATDLVAA
jgi:hypothetical protein